MSAGMRGINAVSDTHEQRVQYKACIMLKYLNKSKLRLSCNLKKKEEKKERKENGK